MMNSLDEAIKHCEEVAEEQEKMAKEWHENQVRKCKLIRFAEMDYTHENECKECASEHRQLAEWLRELQRYRFEISECKAILDNPTPDVTENDKKRAMYVLQTFPDVRGG